MKDIKVRILLRNSQNYYFKNIALILCSSNAISKIYNNSILLALLYFNNLKYCNQFKNL